MQGLHLFETAYPPACLCIPEYASQVPSHGSHALIKFVPVLAK